MSVQLLQSHSEWFIKCSFILRYSAVTQGITFSQGLFGATVNDQQHTIVVQLSTRQALDKPDALSYVHKSAWKSTNVLDLDLCT